MQSYNRVLGLLDAFIRKYYANQLLRGILVLLSCVFAYVLIASISEYYLYLPVAARVSIVSLFCAAGTAATLFWIILPAARMARLGKVISHEQAAVIVGRHFPEVADSLLNVLQLNAGLADGSTALLEASIEQKSKRIAIVPIPKAVDLTKNKRFLPYLLPPMLVGLFLLIAAPNVFRDAGERLLQPTKTFTRPAPFRFVVLSEPLVGLRNTDFPLRIEARGSALPADMSIEIGDETLPMQAAGSAKFQYIFRNLTGPVKFRLTAAGFSSKEYTLQIAQKPSIKSFRVSIDYPDYTGRKDEVRSSLGDLIIPAGTSISYTLATEATENVQWQWGSGMSLSLGGKSGVFSFAHRYLRDTSYAISLHNRQTKLSDTFRYGVQVVRDEYPAVQVQEFRDSLSGKQVLLQGTAGDDYGISRVQFHVDITDASGRAINSKSIPLRNGGGGTLSSFQQYIDIDALNLQMGQKVSYYVEAWDNDAVFGPKAARSEVMSYQMFSPRQLDSALDKNAAQVAAGLSSSAKQNKAVQQEIREAQSKLLQSNAQEWDAPRNMQELTEKQEQLKQQLEATKKRFEEQLQQSKQKEYSEDLKEKQAVLKDQMDNLLHKELQEQMKKLQELMQKLTKEEAMQKLEQMQEQNKLFDMDMKRMQELMKQLEMEMRMEDLAGKMDELAKKQLDLKKETDKGEADAKSLEKKQDELKKALEKMMGEDMKKLDDLAKEAGKKQDLDKAKEDSKEAGSEMEKSSEELSKDEKQKSSKSQQNAADKLQQMSSSMKAAASGMSPEQIDIDIKATRQILSNLMRLSFDQEDLMDNVRATNAASPSYLTNMNEQGRLHGASRIIRDSLFALSKRVFQLAATINKETTELEQNMKLSAEGLEARAVGVALTREQYVMTHTNNLALMLNELLANLIQQQNQSQSSGQGMCNKPGGKKPKPGPGKQLQDIISSQKQLGEAMKKAEEEGKKKGEGKKDGEGEGDKGKKPGEKPGGDKPGESGQNGGEGGSGEYGNSEQLAKFAAQQAALRRQIQDLQQQLNSKGPGGAKELREVQQQMDKNETDLVNRRLNGDLVKRQQQIMSRLLEAEKSLREQDEDDKRSSNSGKEMTPAVPAELQRYMQDREKLMEMYRTVPAGLKPYYRNMVEQYYRNIGAR